MPRKATPPTCSKEVRKQLEDISRSRTEPFQRVERSRIVLACLDGEAIKDIAKAFKTGGNRVIKWRDRFVRHGIQGLNDESRSGKPPTYGKDFRNKVLATLEEAPPKGFARWDGKRLSERLNSSPDAVWRVLSKEGDISSKTAILVRKHRSRVCYKGSRYSCHIFKSTR